MNEDEALQEMMSLGDDSVSTETTETVVANAATEDNLNNYTLSLDKDKFTELTSSLGLIQNICGDCEINHGHIRCKTDDHRNLIMMDLTNILGEKNIAFSGLKNKLALLSTFTLVPDLNGTENCILIQANESNFEFSDNMSELIVRRPVSQYLNNVFINDEDFQAISNSIIREDAVLFRASISSIEKKRMAKLCDAFCTNSVIFQFDGDTCSYYVQTTSKDNVSKTAQVIPLNSTIQGKKIDFNNLAFMLDTPSNLNITCYSIDNSYCMLKSEIDYYTIPITILTKTRIVDINND